MRPQTSHVIRTPLLYTSRVLCGWICISYNLNGWNHNALAQKWHRTIFGLHWNRIALVFRPMWSDSIRFHTAFCGPIWGCHQFHSDIRSGSESSVNCLRVRRNAGIRTEIMLVPVLHQCEPWLNLPNESRQKTVQSKKTVAFPSAPMQHIYFIMQQNPHTNYTGHFGHSICLLTSQVETQGLIYQTWSMQNLVQLCKETNPPLCFIVNWTSWS